MYLVFEYVDRNLLELLEEKPSGIDVKFLILAWLNTLHYLPINFCYTLLSSNGCYT